MEWKKKVENYVRDIMMGMKICPFMKSHDDKDMIQNNYCVAVSLQINELDEKKRARGRAC